MSTLVTRPRPRAFWADLRFLLGVGLVVLSVAGVWGVVQASRESAPYLVATRTIAVGEEITADDVEVVEVALGSATDGYAAPGSIEPGSVATRTIVDGELVPHAAVGTPAEVSTTTVVVESQTDVPQAISAGSEVEVWVAAALGQGEFGDPALLIEHATVLSVTRDETMLGTTGVAVELVIDRGDVAAALGAVADGSALSIVPGSVGG